MDPSQRTCAVCLSEYEAGDEMRILPCSGLHRFHKRQVLPQFKLVWVCCCCCYCCCCCLFVILDVSFCDEVLVCAGFVSCALQFPFPATRCVDEWLVLNATCPQCRDPVVARPGAGAAAAGSAAAPAALGSQPGASAPYLAHHQAPQSAFAL